MKPSVRDTHRAQQAAIPTAELTSTLTGEDDTTPTWPHHLWGGAHTLNFTGLSPDDYLDLPIHLEGDILP